MHSQNLVTAGVGLVHNEHPRLALLDVVKCHHTDISTRVGGTAGLHFAQYLLGTAGIEHGQFPHGPIGIGGVGSFIEFHRRKEALFEQVINLAGNLRIAEGRQIGKGFVSSLFG
jgi:hypothetical protein